VRGTNGPRKRVADDLSRGRRSYLSLDYRVGFMIRFFRPGERGRAT
jgi:hypothetical protein